MSEILNLAIQSIEQTKNAWCRFITGNDTGKTGSHQAGFYIPKCASSLLFDRPGQKGENLDKLVQIKWQNDFVTDSRVIYYGKGTRNEYRITRFGRSFPFLQDDHVGDLLILVKISDDYYHGYVLSSDEDIDDFFSYFNLSPSESNQLISVDNPTSTDEHLAHLINEFVSKYEDFPSTMEMAKCAQDCYNKAYQVTSTYLKNYSDKVLLKWIETEYRLFKNLETKIYSYITSTPFINVDSFVKTANEVLNRRKSRAGKSLEHHLASIFTNNGLMFEEQAVTEDNKKPDFLFPNSKCYHNLLFPAEQLTILGAKTTCKDRWRQVLSEADRVDCKYLFTLQQAISKNQLKEMNDSNLTLVVPREYINSFPQEYRDNILHLGGFISIVRKRQESIPRHFLI